MESRGKYLWAGGQKQGRTQIELQIGSSSCPSAPPSICYNFFVHTRHAPHRAFFAILLVSLFFVLGEHALAQSANAPTISNVTVTGITATSAVVAWTTDTPSDSSINYCLTKDYGIQRDPTTGTQHSIVLNDLDPTTLYHLRVGSQDVSGNQALSGDYTLITKGILMIKSAQVLSPEEQMHVEKAAEEIQQLQTPDAIKIVQEQITQASQKKSSPPMLMALPQIEEVGEDYAVIGWDTDDDSTSEVDFARETEYDASRPDQYSAQTNDESMSTSHHVRLNGLVSGTTYHIRAGSKNALGLTGYSRDTSFMTKSAMPTIQSFRVMKTEADSATLGWKTTVPAAGVVEYTDMKTHQVRSAGSPVFASTQAVKIAGLVLGARYRAVVKAENAAGDKVTSDPLYFSTVKDTTPPVISKVDNESTLYPTDDVKVQTIVTWATDEPAYCTFHYRAGLNPTVQPTSFDEEKEPRTAHTEVIVEFQPSTVYQFWMTCRDVSRNSADSDKFVLFTPNKEKSIIDIILENFQGAFGWVKNVGGKKG